MLYKIGGKRGRDRPQTKDPVIQALLKFLFKLVTILLLLVLVFKFVFGIYRVNDTAMVPNVNPGDLIFYYRLDKKYFVGDTVVYNFKGQTKLARIVALPGDKVDVDEHGLKVNGSRQYEPKIFKETQAFKDGVCFPLQLGTDEVFVLADNRDKAADSRLFGALKRSQISGKIFNLIRSRGI